MVDLKKYENKKIAIYGMGITGCSAAKILKKNKAKVYCWDDNAKVRENIRRLNFKVEKFWLKNNSLKNIVISPGIDIRKCKIKSFLQKNFNKIITDIDIFFELNKKALIISITGTNGKSSTCKIIEKILKEAKYNVKTIGNIGNPILFSDKIKKKFVYILEISSYQLEYSKLFRTKHAAILNISPDHLERHKNINNYIKIKSKIFSIQDKKDYTYINYQNKYTKNIKKIYKKSKIKSKLIEIRSSNFKFFLNKIKNKNIRSKGNIENLCFAYKICKNLKINDQTIINGVNKYKNLPHRQEVVFSRKKILCINDSKATSFDASLQALLNYNKIYWIVGGLPKFKDKFFLEKIKKKVIRAYIIGKHSSFFKKQINKNIEYKISKNINNSINQIYNDIKYEKKEKITILFSPAAASFDQFENFEARGSYFKKLIINKFKKV